jgi:two-component system sensor histidine kinase AlgZ
MSPLRPPSSVKERRGGRPAPRVSAGATREWLAPAAPAPEALSAHFLANALHAIATLVRGQRAAEAVRALEQLGDLHRMILLHSHRFTWSLAEELAFVRRYAEFERLRFGERLDVSFEIAAGLGEVAVPTLALQTLVENAFKHGVARRVGRSRVAIRAVAEEDWLVLTVCNDRPDFAAPVPGLGFGLRAVRAQLAVLHDGHASLRVDLHAAAGVVATLRLPLACALPCRR